MLCCRKLGLKASAIGGGWWALSLHTHHLQRALCRELGWVHGRQELCPQGVESHSGKLMLEARRCGLSGAWEGVDLGLWPCLDWLSVSHLRFFSRLKDPVSGMY